MRRVRALSFSFFLLLLLIPTLAQAGTYTAASCNYSDVNAVINGPTHTAANGDTINIPSGTCTWTSGITVTVNITIQGSGAPNSLPSQFGAGTLNTVIVDDYPSGGMFQAQIGYGPGQLFRISTIDIEPESASTSLWSPVSIAGTCTSLGCPNVRLDNIGLGLATQWNESGNSTNAGTMIRADDVFGVIDHCTQPSGSQVWFANVHDSAYLGVGGYGDNSWAQADTFGTASNLFLENNLIYTNTSVVDAEFAPAGGGIGGGRYVGRFNEINTNTGFFGAFSFHGLDTDGRPQGGRHIAAYGNIVNCAGGSCGDGVAGFRSGTGLVFGNTLDANYSASGGFYNNIFQISVYRTVFSASSGWGACGGSSPYDTNGGTVYYSGTLTSASGGGSSGSTITVGDASKSWTTNQFVPTGAPYSIYDETRGWWMEIASNTGNTLTTEVEIPEATNTASIGDSYQILRATVCADQGGRGAGNYVSGATPSTASALSQALDPIYEWDDTAQELTSGNVSTDTGRVIANRDWYTDNSNGTPHVQTSPTSPFNGASGVGFGTLANRPATCTPRVGYFATDKGNWNQSGNGFGQGELFVCTATNTWTLDYTPYTYPHPLITGGPTGPSPVTNLSATVVTGQ